MEHRTAERVVKIPLPLVLIREIDEAIVSGLGGYSTRTEFFRDAAENLLLELKYQPAPDEPRALVRPPRSSATPGVEAPSTLRDAESERSMVTNPPLIEGARTTAIGMNDLGATLLRLEREGAAMADGEAEVNDDPLFGMHNRDYPSLWVAHRLAERVESGPVPYEAFIDEVTAEAWDYADALRSLETAAGQKLTALFPTNREKPQSAAGGFRAFAIGSVLNGKRDRLGVEGALFAWRVCQVKRAHDGGVLIGLTSEGWQLLRRLEGISLVLPHSAELARTFLSHLRAHSAGDWWGFQTVLAAAAEQPNRLGVIEAFRTARGDWSESVAATNAQGYIARAREWGLVQPKQVAGRYMLTDFGAEYLDGISNRNVTYDTN